MHDRIVDMFFRRVAKGPGRHPQVQDEIEGVQDRDHPDYDREHLQPEYQHPDHPEQPDDTQCHDLPAGERLQGGKFRSKRSKGGHLFLTNFHDLCCFLNIVVDLFCIIIEYIMLGLLGKPIGIIFHLLATMRVSMGRVDIMY